MEKKENWENRNSTMYKEAGSMLRHFSMSRTLSLTLLLPICLAMVGWAISNTENRPMLVFLVISELMIFCSACLLSVYFSIRCNKIRQCLIELESDEDVNIYNRLDTISIVNDFKIDIFDKFVGVIGLLVHIGFYSYLAAT